MKKSLLVIPVFLTVCAFVNPFAFTRQNNQGSENGISDFPGLLVDLDADKGITTDESGRVIQWENQANFEKARFFKKTDLGRKSPCEGCPVYSKKVKVINNHNAVIFKEQELLNDSEDAFDHLITGNGYTFFCVVAPHQQRVGLKDVNSFLGNLRNGGNYEGIWAGFTDNNKFWAGTRNGITFGRWDHNNPFFSSPAPLISDRYYLLAGKMDDGKKEALITLYINDITKPVNFGIVPVNPKANASKLAIGQERDATQHPGVESFHGEMTRFLLFERPLNNVEMDLIAKNLIRTYKIQMK